MFVGRCNAGSYDLVLLAVSPVVVRTQEAVLVVKFQGWILERSGKWRAVCLQGGTYRANDDLLGRVACYDKAANQYVICGADSDAGGNIYRAFGRQGKEQGKCRCAVGIGGEELHIRYDAA